jgi:peptidyl-prolyl cis-trans isomerase C
MTRRLLALAGALSLLLVAWAGCNSGDAPEEASENGDERAYAIGEPVQDSTIALIVSSEYGTDTIQADRYGSQYNLVLRNTPPNRRSGEGRQQLHRNMVRQFAGNHVVAAEARRTGVEADSQMVAQQMQAQRRQFTDEDGNFDEAAFDQALAQAGLSRDSLRALIADQTRVQKQRQKMAEVDAPNPDSVEAYAEENRRFNVQHILLQLEEDVPESVEDSVRGVAEALIDSAEAGVPFDSLAMRNSEGMTASRGGNIGYQQKRTLVDPFANAALALQDSGDVYPEPVRTRFGYHVIRLLDPGEPMDTTEARQALMEERQRDAYETNLNALLEKVTVRINPDIVKANYDDA